MPLGDAVGVGAVARADVALAGVVVEGVVLGAAALLGAEDLDVQQLLTPAEAPAVAACRRDGAAAGARAGAELGRGGEGGVDLALVQDVVPRGGGVEGDDVRDGARVDVGVALACCGLRDASTVAVCSPPAERARTDAQTT